MKIRNRVMVRVWKAAYAPLLRRAARQILKGRLFDLDEPKKGRWLEADVKELLDRTFERVKSLMPIAELDKLPAYGNRHNVFLAVITTSCYQILLERGVRPDYAKRLVADVGWKVYSWMVASVNLPFRIAIRDPGPRLEKVLRTLMIYPFSAPGAPGYEAKVWTEGNNTFTHWTHCPPQAFVRRLVELNGDRGELDAFYQSWCLYDWPASDIMVNDGKHGHYTREHTLSRGDSVCDMCWYGYAQVETTSKGE